MERRKCRQISVGGVKIGGDAPIAVQSMTNTKTADVSATADQINVLKAAGCDIVRLAVPDIDAAHAIYEIKSKVDMPIVADIHFDYRLALAAIEGGADKIRINPGNIGSDDRVKAVADACSARNIPIRIGVNSGSVEPHILAKYGHPCPEALCESALYHKSLLNKFDFDDICISIKSSSVQSTVAANILLAQQCDCPLHLGVTEAGTIHMGTLKSAAGIGGLLSMGIGDTIRVSLTAPPEQEIYAADDILRAIGIRKNGAELVSCPMCGRCRINLIDIAQQVEKRIKPLKSNLKVAVMGCAVNGPGEAREADVGLAGGDDCGIIFVKGEIVKKLPQDKLVDGLFEEIEKLTGERL